MPTYEIPLQNTLLTAHNDAVASGSIVILDGATTIATLTLDGTPFAAPSGGSMALADTPLTVDSVAATTDNATELVAEFRNSGGTAQFTLTVGVTGGSEEMILNTPAHSTNASKPNITSGQQVEISSSTLSY